MAREFSMQRGGVRVVFGNGAAEHAADEIAALGVSRVLVVSSPGRRAEAEAMAAKLGERSAGTLAIAREHVPASVVADGLAAAANAKADALVALGGGTALGLAKAIAAEHPARIVAIPTTYSGSETTPIFGVTRDGEKRTTRDERVRPALVIYDPLLSRALPRDATIASLWNAMAHASSTLWSKSPDRAALLSAEAGLRLLASALVRLGARIDDLEARADALEGAYLAGSAFADTGAGLHHKICHVLGGRFALPHGPTHAALLPHVVRFHAEAAPDAMIAIARALGALDATAGFERLSRDTGVRSLEALGMPREGIGQAADALLVNPAFYPRSLERTTITELLERAFTGFAPRGEAPPLRAPASVGAQPGIGSTHDSEALPGALPRRQNTPRPAPYGLYPELLSGTPFTVQNRENSRMWMYRVRPSFSHGPLTLLPAPLFTNAFGAVEANRTRWQPLPVPKAPARVPFLDGLVTLGGAGDPTTGPGFAVHLYAANADMVDQSFSNADGDVLLVPQTGTLDCRTELGWLRVAPGSILLVPRGLKFAVGLPDGAARGWMLEVFGPRMRLPERGPIGSNGLADARHFLAPTAAFEDRLCPDGFEVVTKLGGQLFAGKQEHSPFDVVAWHGSHAPFTYDLSLFNAMGSVTFDHPDPSILTVLTAPLDDKGRAVVDFVVFPGRWNVAEHSFRPPFMHRNAASEINGVIKTPGASDGSYVPGCTFVSPLLAPHGISTKSYDHVLSLPDDVAEAPQRLSDESLWMMFESALPFRTTTWARETPLVDRAFLDEFKGMRSRFDAERR